MEMKVDSARIREERLSRAWSQEHMAAITGLGLRTIQRIESTGGASHESVAAISSVIEVPVDQLIVTGTFKQSLAELLWAKRLWILLPFVPVALVVTPPELSSQLLAILSLWVGFELVIAAVRWKNIHI